MQKIPTQKSATARLAKKKFVIERNLLLKVTTKITRRLPVIIIIFIFIPTFIFLDVKYIDLFTYQRSTDKKRWYIR